VLSERIFLEDAQGQMVPHTDAARLVVNGWSAMVEELVLTWKVEPGDVTREQLLDLMAGSLPALIGVLPSP